MPVFTVTDSSVGQVFPEDVQRLIDATQVVDVRLDEVHAGPVGLISNDMTISVDVDEPQLGRPEESDLILVRLTHRVSCDPGGGDEATHLSVSHIVTMRASEDVATTWPAVAAWVETNLYFIVYPYVRQTVSTLSTTLGMPAVVLGYLGREERPLTGAIRAVNDGSQSPSD